LFHPARTGPARPRRHRLQEGRSHGGLGEVGCGHGKSPAAPAEGAAEADPGPAPAEQVKKAIADFKAGKMEDAVTRLQLLRAQPVMSPEQRMALQDNIASVMQEVYAMAQKGDVRAKAAVAQYERMQTAR